MNKKWSLLFISLCIVLSVGLVLINFNKGLLKAEAGRGGNGFLRNGSFLTEGVSYDLLSGTTSANIEITLSPSSTKVDSGGTVQFTATVTGTSNPLVKWSIDGSSNPKINGTISPQGLYTAPEAYNIFTVSISATSVANKKVATATVNIKPPDTGISIFGNLSDKNKHPLSNNLITLKSQSNGEEFYYGGGCRTDSRGEYKFTGMTRTGIYTVRAFKEFKFDVTADDVAAREKFVVNLSLPVKKSPTK